MHFRDEILRGIRLAAILFTLLLLGVVFYRTVHIDFKPPAKVAEQPVETPKPAAKTGIKGGSPGSIPPGPPIRGNSVTLVRNGDTEK